MLGNADVGLVLLAAEKCFRLDQVDGRRQRIVAQRLLLFLVEFL